MTEYVHLIGAEDVAQAGRAMQVAAEYIRQTHNYRSDAEDRFAAKLEELVTRLENLGSGIITVRCDGGAKGGGYASE